MSESNATPPASVVPAAAAQGSVTTDNTTPSSTSSGAGRGGRGRGRGGRSGRGRSSQAGRGRGASTNSRAAGPVFKGNTDGMKGNVFQCHGEQSSDKQQFMKSIGVLDEYINKTFVYPQDVASVCKTFEVTPLVQPPNLSAEAYKNDMGAKMIWEASMKNYMKRVDLLESNTIAIYAIVWGQCSPMMQSKLESLDAFKTKSKICDCIWLMKEIQGITHRFEGTRNVFISLDDAWTQYYSQKQGAQTPLYEYLKDFQSSVQVLEHYGAVIGADGPNQDSVMAEVREKVHGLAEADYTTRAILAAKRKSIAISFLKRADRERFGGLWGDLENQYSRGLDHYPSDIVAAYNLLLNYKPPPKQYQRRQQHHEEPSDDMSALTFLQNTDAPTPGTDGITHPAIKCFNCNVKGHYADMCPSRDGVTLLQVEPAATNEAQDNTDEEPEAEETPEEYHEEDDETPYVSEFTFVNIEKDKAFGFHQSSNLIPSSWILLDSQSTVSVFKNKRLLHDIRDSPTTLRVHTNGGTQLSHQIGTVKNFGDVWFNPESLANILSMSEVSKICRITMDTHIENAMHVHRTDGSMMTFKEYKSGLYYFDAAAAVVAPKTTNENSDDYLFLHTVDGNMAEYTRREIDNAKKARLLYKKIGNPSEQDFSEILKEGRIRNCPLTPDDARRALHIWGPEVQTLEGKMTKQQNKGIPNYKPILIPAPIIDKYKTIRLFIDIFWVNGSPYFHTISEHIKFRTVAPIQNRTKRTLLMETRAILHLYATRGFIISRIEGDREFSCIVNDVLPTALNVADADDHVHEVERSIRTIKERVRCTVQGLPYRRLPRVLIRSIVEGAHKSLNQFPVKNGASAVLSPLTIMTGSPSPDYNDFKIELGAYAHVFEDNEPTNINQTRSTGAIALTPTGNAQGGYFFLSLTTGRKISRQQWTELPIPHGVIATVEAMAIGDDQPLMGNGGPAFEWSPGIAIADEQHVPILIDEVDNEPDQEVAQVANVDDAAPDQEVAQDDANADDQAELIPPDNDGDELRSDTEGHEIDNEESNEEGSEEEGNEEGSEEGSEEEGNEEGSEEEENDQEQHGGDDHDDNNNQPPALEPRYNLRPNRERTYGNRFSVSMDNPDSSRSYDTQFLQTGSSPHQGRSEPNTKDTTGSHDESFLQQGASLLPTLREAVETYNTSGSDTELLSCITGFIMTQMTAKAGIKKHGQVAINALYQEFLQLHDLDVFEGQHASALTTAEKRAALRAISVIKEKRCGKIKGRTVADGRNQKGLFSKDETSSPTVSVDALMMSIMIDAYERRDVATADVAGAYLHARLKDFTLLKVEGESVDILCSVSEKYKAFVTVEKNGKKVIYLRLKKALYGCVQSALLWYDLFTGTLQKMGFELNPYDTCVANKVVDGKQCTIAWYVDDNKISHVDPKVVTSIIKKIEERFGKMTVTRGKVHVFLGMKITYHENGTAEIDTSEYIKESIEDFPEHVNKTAVTPATRGLFEIDDKSLRLENERDKIFHSIVAKLLYVSHRGRQDIQLPIAFLCTRVSKSTEQDWKKLRRVLEYLNGSIEDTRFVGADDLQKMKTWVDAAYAVHADMRSHTGGAVSFGTGVHCSKCNKQRINVKSSTEAELVGASDYLPYAIWTRKFMERQGYAIISNIFYQDNESAIRFEKNGRKSSGPNSKHIDIRYFFIKDRLETDGFTVEHCPTEQMLADFFTKPLQGNLFRRLREVVMGRQHIDTLKNITSAKSQERVEKDEIKDETMANEQSTDRNHIRHSTRKDEHVKRPTYAEAVKSQQRQQGKAEHESKAQELTFKK